MLFFGLACAGFCFFLFSFSLPPALVYPPHPPPPDRRTARVTAARDWGRWLVPRSTRWQQQREMVVVCGGGSLGDRSGNGGDQGGAEIATVSAAVSFFWVLRPSCSTAHLHPLHPQVGTDKPSSLAVFFPARNVLSPFLFFLFRFCGM